jgi:hypothetical protein
MRLLMGLFPSWEIASVPMPVTIPPNLYPLIRGLV